MGRWPAAAFRWELTPRIVSSVVGCGVLLPTFDPFRTGEIPLLEGARRAEALGFDSAWVGDHLACPAPNLDGPTSLAVAAAVTTEIELGFSILLLGMRKLAWTAKQLITLQALSAGRLSIGVGVGGEFPQEFAAAGVPVAGGPSSIRRCSC
ncbi:MAG: LLM class flavin-dependent oxidoreductase [Solirubrobacteraceae bacterium]